MDAFLPKAFFLIWVVLAKNFPANGTVRKTDHLCSSGLDTENQENRTRALLRMAMVTDTMTAAQVVSHCLFDVGKMLSMHSWLFITLAPPALHKEKQCHRSWRSWLKVIQLMQDWLQSPGSWPLGHMPQPITPPCLYATHSGLPWALEFSHINSMLLADPT